MDAKSKLMAYLKGWAHGAGRKAIQFQDQPDYMRGYQEGYDAYCKVTAEAQEHYGAKLSILRLQKPQFDANGVCTTCLGEGVIITCHLDDPEGHGGLRPCPACKDATWQEGWRLVD